MAIDTRERRASAIGMGRPWRVQLPRPDGTVATADRQQVGYRYVGILSGAAVIPGLVNYIAAYIAVSRPVARRL
jgi:hypothetical protein